MITFDIEMLGQEIPISVDNDSIVELLSDGNKLDLIEKLCESLIDDGTELTHVVLKSLLKKMDKKLNKK